MMYLDDVIPTDDVDPCTCK
jgi:hypothetical protein